MPETQNVLNPRDVSRDIFSATIGSICCCYTGQPLDTLKVRMQTQPTIYKTIIQSTKKTISEEGLKALWKGAVPTALGMAAENAMAFGVNEALKRTFPNDNDNNIFEEPNRDYKNESSFKFYKKNTTYIL